MFNINIKWLSNACFEIERDGITIVTDPYITDNKFSPCTVDDVEHCSIITLSHSHYDHVTDIPLLMNRFNPALICGSGTAMPLWKWVNCNAMRIYQMDVNQELDLRKVKIKALFGQHITRAGTFQERLEKIANWEEVAADPSMMELQLWGELEYRNYLYTYSDGLKVLVWGGGFKYPQRALLREVQPDIAIMQATVLQDPRLLAEFYAESGAKVIIPHHMAYTKPYDEERAALFSLKEELSTVMPETKFAIPEPGVWMSF